MKSIKLEMVKPYRSSGFRINSIYHRFELNIDFEDDWSSYTKCLNELNEVQDKLEEIVSKYVRNNNA